ncbi:hypothetical protein AgCh_016382 [Apium graveolens]
MLCVCDREKGAPNSFILDVPQDSPSSQGPFALCRIIKKNEQGISMIEIKCTLLMFQIRRLACLNVSNLTPYTAICWIHHICCVMYTFRVLKTRWSPYISLKRVLPPSYPGLTAELMTAYEQLAKTKNFEVVLFYVYDMASTLGCTNEDTFWNKFKTMP